MKPRLILASQSIGRKRLLEYLKIPFEIVPSSLDEDKIEGASPVETIRLRAKMKGEEVAKQITQSSNNPITQSIRQMTNDQSLMTVLIVSADSDAILDGKLYSKPHTYKDAFHTLRTLSGRTHDFVTCTYIIQIGLISPISQIRKEILLDDIERSFVTFRTMTDEDIKRYLKVTDYTRFAGGYAISSAQNFITKIEGSISNVIGLPLEKVAPLLQSI